jgi:hypothetical protein
MKSRRMKPSEIVLKMEKWGERESDGGGKSNQDIL